ncbi:uncharacterized protein LOC113676195 [Pocillopora damicornis]|uniref:uncharacterized protein LOC113676195 n=1 Tax=Pocillopora damicornis TaxID=46731 RepID=UPI000F54F36D|nr:uncharacterized protein LOC113676195 [Pocillopora damicornis]
MLYPKLVVLLLASFSKEFSEATGQCGLVNRTEHGLDKVCGYEFTAQYDYKHHFTSASRAVPTLIRLLKNCSATVNTMICSLFVPRCEEDIPGPYLPCRAVCYDYATRCRDVIAEKGLQWTVAMCDILPERDDPNTKLGYRGRCFTPPNFKDSGKTYKHNCSDIVVPACKGIPGYTQTVVSEAIQRRYQRYIDGTIGLRTNGTCYEKRKEIVCAENLPGCIDGSAAFLCRDTCEKFFNTCKSPFFYEKDMCMEFPSRESTPKSASVCKQTHWPRAENWNFSATPTGQPVTASTEGVMTSFSRSPTTSSSRGLEGITKHTDQSSSVSTRGTKIFVPTKIFAHSQGTVILSSPQPKGTTKHTEKQLPGIHARKSIKDEDSKTNKVAIGLIATFIVILVIAIGIVGVLFYRKKRRSRQFDYQKQILYSEGKADEFEIFT